VLGTGVEVKPPLGASERAALSMLERRPPSRGGLPVRYCGMPSMAKARRCVFFADLPDLHKILATSRLRPHTFVRP
jgi:hypothetical protein